MKAVVKQWFARIEDAFRQHYLLVLILLCFFLVSVVLNTAFVIVLSHRLENIVWQREHSTVEALKQQAFGAVDSLLGRLITDAYSLFSVVPETYVALYDDEISPEEAFQATRRLDQFKAGYPFINSIYLYNNQADQIIVVSNEFKARRSKAGFFDEEYMPFLEKLQPQTTSLLQPRSVSYTYYDKHVQQQCITLSYVRHDRAGQIEAALSVNIDESALRAALGIEEKEGLRVQLLNTEGMVLADSYGGIGESVQQEKYFKSIVDDGGAEGSFAVHTEQGETQVLYGLSRNDSYYLCILAYSPLYQAQIQTIRTSIAWISICYLLVCVLLSFMMAQRIYNPYRKLKEKLLQGMTVDTGAKTELDAVERSVERLFKRVQASNVNEYQLEQLQKRELLHMLVSQPMNKDDCIDLAGHGVALAEGSQVALAVRIDHFNQLKQLYRELIPLLKYTALKILCDEISTQFPCEGVEMYGDMSYIIVSLKQGQAGALCTALHQAQSLVAHQLKMLTVGDEDEQVADREMSLTIGIGDAASDMGKTYLSCLHALAASEFRLLMGTGQLICYETVKERLAHKWAYTAGAERTLFAAIRSGSAQRMEESLAQIFSKETINNPNEVMLVVNYLLIQLKNSFISDPGDTHFITSYNATIEGIDRCETLEQIADLMTYICLDCTRVLDGTAEKRRNRTAEKIKRYADVHFCECNCVVENIAKSVGLSTNYTRVMFKQRYGVSLTDYINSKRLQRAAELLETTDRQAAQIAEEIGFNDQSYFYVVFRKAFGMTTKQYRAQKERLNAGTVHSN